jgi:fatty-acyl-CoA synthase
MAELRPQPAPWPDRATRRVAPTLAAAVEALREDTGRGFTFVNPEGVERFYSFHDLHAEALRRSFGLRRLGIAKGERVTLIIPESDDFVLTFLGAVLAGIVPVPLSPRVGFKASDGYLDTVCHVTTAAGSVAIVTTVATREHVEAARVRCPAVRQLIDMQELAAASAGPALPPVDVGPDDLAFLQFTSGSTSLPKGVAVQHRHLAANCAAFMYEGLDADPASGDKGISWLPLFHDMGLIGFVMGPLFTNIPVVFLPTASFARSPRVWLETAHRHRATITYAPNFGYALAAKRLKPRDLEGLDLSGLRIAGCGAEPIQAQTLAAFAEKLAPTGFRAQFLLPSYGMAEATLAVSFGRRDEPVRSDRVDADALGLGQATPSSGADVSDVVCCGRPFDGHEVRIVDEQSQPVAERKVGQIVVKGPSICGGYFGNAEATRESFRDGWLHTGDLGYMVGGELYVCGRLKDVIIIRGRNFYPQDIEWCVGQIEGARRDNIVAFGVQAEGEERLVIVAEAPRSQSERLLTDIPRRVLEEIGLNVWKVELVGPGSLPKTSSGKPQRRKTKALWLDGRLVRSTEVVVERQEV